MEMRKATKAEVKALANAEGLAPNSVFDGVNYMVAVKKETKGAGNKQSEGEGDTDKGTKESSDTK